MEITPDLLKKYGAGTCTPEEQRLVERWLREENTGAYYDFMPGTEPESEKGRIDAAIDAHLARKKPRFPFGLPAVAASWLVLAVIGSYVYLTINAPAEIPPLTYQTVQVPNGKKIEITLPDGSKAYLNSGTTLIYPEAFEGTERLLMLEGEAFFEVAKQAGKPFVVQANGTRTEVLGTQFNVNGFAVDGKTILSVEQGRVMFTADDSRDTLLLGPNNRAVHQKGRLLLEETTAFKDSGWKDGHLSFNHSSIAEMIPILERWYDVRITVSNPEMSAYRMKARYENPSLQRILEDLAYTTDIKFKIEGKAVTIYR